jgi:hypothetical protein
VPIALKVNAGVAGRIVTLERHSGRFAFEGFIEPWSVVLIQELPI